MVNSKISLVKQSTDHRPIWKKIQQKGIFVLYFAALNFSGLYAQYTHEIGFLMGLSNYQGDLPEPHVELIESQLAGGIYYKYHFDSNWSLRSNLFVGQISGDDRWADSRSFRKFKFTSQLIELAILGEWKPFARRSNYYVGMFQRYLTPYLFAGIAFTRSNPKPDCYHEDCLNGSNPFALEMKQTNFIAIPYGLGIRYDMTPKSSLGFEIGQRPVFSDVLDGVSVSANPDRNDWYIISGVTFSYLFGQKRYRDINYQ